MERQQLQLLLFLLQQQLLQQLLLPQPQLLLLTLNQMGRDLNTSRKKTKLERTITESPKNLRA